jgi:hypothetical protein
MRSRVGEFCRCRCRTKYLKVGNHRNGVCPQLTALAILTFLEGLTKQPYPREEWLNLPEPN